jgi:DNA-binding transcriptional MocR family regulator
VTNWRPDPAQLSRPVYRSLAGAIADAISDGSLRPGDRLPTHRDMAHALGVSVQTVSRAYDALIRADLLAGTVGRGTFVKHAPPDGRTSPYQQLAADDSVIDCSMLVPVTGPLHQQAMDAALAGLVGTTPPEVLFSFRPHQALQRHSERALQWLRICGLDVRADCVLPTNGATGAMTVALMAAVPPGGTVLAETMGHHTLQALTRYLGLKLTGVACDSQGMIPEALDAACRSGDHAARALYLFSSRNSPLNTETGPDRRRELVALAVRHGLYIIENDAWGPLQPDRPAPLFTLAPDRVFYFTSLTKCLLPGLRLGWLVMPEGQAAAAFARHQATVWMATALIAEIGSRWIADGTAERLLAWQRTQLEARNALARRCLAGLPVRGHPHGLHVWLQLPEAWEESAFVNSARLRGVAVAPGHAFRLGAGKPPERGVRICLGGGTESALEEALKTLSRLALSLPEPEFLAF